MLKGAEVWQEQRWCRGGAGADVHRCLGTGAKLHRCSRCRCKVAKLQSYTGAGAGAGAEIMQRFRHGGAGVLKRSSGGASAEVKEQRC